MKIDTQSSASTILSALHRANSDWGRVEAKIAAEGTTTKATRQVGSTLAKATTVRVVSHAGSDNEKQAARLLNAFDEFCRCAKVAGNEMTAILKECSGEVSPVKTVKPKNGATAEALAEAPPA